MCITIGFLSRRAGQKTLQAPQEGEYLANNHGVFSNIESPFAKETVMLPSKNSWRIVYTYLPRMMVESLEQASLRPPLSWWQMLAFPPALITYISTKVATACNFISDGGSAWSATQKLWISFWISAKLQLLWRLLRQIICPASIFACLSLVAWEVRISP